MKKKLSVLLLAILVVPLLALFGCEEASSYPIFVYTSSDPLGSVYGNGTYTDGSTVTLTAVSKQDCHFVAWIYQNSVEIENDDSYKITNTQNSNQMVSKSTLTFTVNSKNQGRYTAVFDKDTTSESKMMYVKLSSYRITTTPNLDGETSDEGKSTFMNANVSIEHGQSSSSLVTVYEKDDLTIFDNVNIYPNETTDVLKMSDTSKQHIKVSAVLTYNGKAMSMNLRADVGFQENTDEVSTANYTYKVTYADGIYQIIFSFKLSADNPCYFVVEYKNLGK